MVGEFFTSILELGGLGRAPRPPPPLRPTLGELSAGRLGSFQSLFNVRINIF